METQKYITQVFFLFSMLHESPENLYNYEKYTESVNDPLGTCYDYLSVMHYDPFGFNIVPNKPAIYTCDQSYQDRIGYVEKASPVDIERIQVLYGCRQPVGSIRISLLSLTFSGA